MCIPNWIERSSAPHRGQHRCAAILSVTVIGADGFVGRHLVAALRHDAVDVLPVVRRFNGSTSSRVLDVTDAAAVRRLFEEKKPDTVIHLAALAHGKHGATKSGEYDRVNRLGFCNVFRAAAEFGARRIVLASSTSVYGDIPRGHALLESDELRPSSAYGRSKRAAEAACAGQDLPSIQSVILRFPAIYSSEFLLNVRKRAYVPGLERRVLLAVIGRQPLYSFCAIQHAIDAMRMAIEGRLASGAYNIADARPYTQREVRQIVARLDGVRLTLPLPGTLLVRIANLTGRVLPSRISDALVANTSKLFAGLVVDTAKITRAGFQPSCTMHDLLALR